jgi:hypothetical protein
MTYLAVHSQDGRILRDGFRSCQGVLAHEVYYQNWAYVYMLHFIIHTYEVYVIWYSRQPSLFRNTTLEVLSFAESLHVNSTQQKEAPYV